ncbi:hypothetical protein JW926_13365 [Candidatus Sumerlaeota bacterium]|nr:hypothetical protein [Candidatus Sumerlaeota bacterium]
MPVISWFSSFIFLGLSVSLGLLIYFLFYAPKKKDKEPDLPPELERQSPESNDASTLENLEKKYGKKG